MHTVSGIKNMARTKLNRGDYLMNKCAKQLIAEGWFVEKAKKVRWVRQDFFGLWDIIAVHPVIPTIRFIQVSAKPDYDKGREWRQKAKDFPVNESSQKEYWWMNGREWVIKTL